MKLLDIGGSYDALSADKIAELINIMLNILTSEQTLVMECGDLWFKNAGTLVTFVELIKEVSQKIKIVYLPFSKDGNLKWSSPKYIESKGSESSEINEYYFYGASCFERDFITVVKTYDLIMENDAIKFSNISPYSVEWNVGFNGIIPIEVYYE